MNILTIILIATGLSFDTFAVSISTGISISGIKFWQAVRIALTLAFFQGLMPLIGWFLGTQVEQFICNYDHWIAFILLLLIGIKMIYESYKKEEDKKQKSLTFPILIFMAIATSIDALVAGVSFAFIDINIYISIFIIGFITFLAAMTGMLFGKTIGVKLGNKMEILGGLILIGIGIRILLCH